MKTELVWILVTLFISVNGEDADHIDTDADNDDEAALKCDACKIVASKFAEYFQEAQGKLRLTTSLKDEDIIEAAEATCDDSWEGYGVTIVSDQERLVGPGSEVPLTKEIESDAVWPRRLQDMCDELLGETPDEKTLYNIWASGSSLTDYLCKGEGLFGACSSSDWGPWPGDEYDDYDDAGDFDYIHDEF